MGTRRTRGLSPEYDDLDPNTLIRALRDIEEDADVLIEDQRLRRIENVEQQIEVLQTGRRARRRRIDVVATLRILDKIVAFGFDSLNENERNTVLSLDPTVLQSQLTLIRGRGVQEEAVAEPEDVVMDDHLEAYEDVGDVIDDPGDFDQGVDEEILEQMDEVPIGLISTRIRMNALILIDQSDLTEDEIEFIQSEPDVYSRALRERTIRELEEDLLQRRINELPRDVATLTRSNLTPRNAFQMYSAAWNLPSIVYNGFTFEWREEYNTTDGGVDRRKADLRMTMEHIAALEERMDRNIHLKSTLSEDLLRSRTNPYMDDADRTRIEVRIQDVTSLIDTIRVTITERKLLASTLRVEIRIRQSQLRSIERRRAETELNTRILRSHIQDLKVSFSHHMERVAPATVNLEPVRNGYSLHVVLMGYALKGKRPPTTQQKHQHAKRVREARLNGTAQPPALPKPSMSTRIASKIMDGTYEGSVREGEEEEGQMRFSFTVEIDSFDEAVDMIYEQLLFRSNAKKYAVYRDYVPFIDNNAPLPYPFMLLSVGVFVFPRIARVMLTRERVRDLINRSVMRGGDPRTELQNVVLKSMEMYTLNCVVESIADFHHVDNKFVIDTMGLTLTHVRDYGVTVENVQTYCNALNVTHRCYSNDGDELYVNVATETRMRRGKAIIYVLYEAAHEKRPI